jgi:hypothetical protein
MKPFDSTNQLFIPKLTRCVCQNRTMQELAELSAETRDIAFRLLEPHLEQHRSSRQTREFPFGRRNFFWLLRQIASKDLRHIAP